MPDWSVNPPLLMISLAGLVYHGKPRCILSDHDSTFYAVEAREREKGLTEFEKYLLRNHIAQMLERVNHLQINGKIEKWFDVFDKKLKFFSSIDDCVSWYNTIKPHGAQI